MNSQSVRDDLRSAGDCIGSDPQEPTLCTTPRWAELTLFLEARPEVRMGHVVDRVDQPEVVAMRRAFGERYYPMTPGQALVGRRLDEIWLDVPLTWSNYRWVSQSLITRLSP